MTIERMFVAITPPPEVIDVLSDLPTKPQRGVKFTRRSQWHITLRFLGSCERAVAINALADLETRARSGLVTLGPSVTLLGERIVIVPAVGAEELAAQAAAAFAGVGQEAPHDFIGHLTLARLKGAPLRDPDSVSVLGAPCSATFEYTTIDLYKVDLKPDGAEYTLVAQAEL